MSAILPTPASTINPTPVLEMSQAELLEVQKWMTRYMEASTNERYNLLKSKILPQLNALNKDLSVNEWKTRKAVSKSKILFISIIVI